VPSDEQLVPPGGIKDQRPARSSGESAQGSQKPITRKPLPPNARLPPAEPVTSTVPAPASEQAALRESQQAQELWIPPGFRLEDSPTFDSFPANPPLPPRPEPPTPQAQGSSPIYRKPLGPRLMESTPPREHHLSLPDRPVFPSAGGQSPQSPSRSTPYSADRERAPPLPDRPVFGQGIHTPPRSVPAHTRVPFALTLIRRDPASGYQWNIGRVTSYQTENPMHGEDDEPPRPVNGKHDPAINIYLESSGYAKFRGGMPFRPGGNNRHSTSSLPQALAQAQLAGEDAAAGRPGPEETFARQVVMSYTKSWASKMGDAFRRPERRKNDDEDNDNSPLEPPQRPPGMHARQDSASSIATVESRRSTDHSPVQNDPAEPITAPGPGLKARGYVFTSPWDGRCEFRTGNGGRSLKCRHTLSSSSSSGFNPLVLAQGIRDGQALRQGRARGASVSSVISGAVEVSELRFNLPSPEIFGGKKDRGGKDFHSKFDKLMRMDPRRGSTSEDEDEGPMDLSLGRERAGGGNRGKRAKLGKLIIYGNGLKMLDLIVAANMGVWWTAWERRF
jgi:hypothetical protein